MKKIYTFAAALFCLLAVGCTRDIMSFSSFDLRDVNFTDDESKMHFVFNGSGSALSYDSGVDHVYVNGSEFTINYSDGTWTANGSSAVTAERFYCAYANGTVGIWNDGDKTYNFNLNLSNTNGIVLAGNTTEHTLTLTPCCAIIRVPLGSSGYTAKVGFDNNKIPRSGVIDADGKKILSAGATMLTGVTAEDAGQFLTMVEDASDHSYYVGVPIVGTSVTTHLFLEWTKGGNTTKYKTTGQVTLEKGKVYTLGSTRVSAFDDNGAGIGLFTVNSNDDFVKFSRGNLVCKPLGAKFAFADNQYSFLGDGNTSIKKSAVSTYDLMAWATSGEGTYNPGLNTNNAGDYYSAGNIENTNYEWGKKNSGSKLYINSSFATLSDSSWRTLTEAEWTYLLGNHEWGLARLHIGGNYYCGIMIKPYAVWVGPATDDYDEWSCEVPFVNGRSSGYLTNNLEAAQWVKLEKSGVIFLPAAGYRGWEGDKIVVNECMDPTGTSGTGYYWTTTITPYDAFATPNHAMAVKIGTDATPTIVNKPRMQGCAIRLVTNTVVN